VTAVRRGFDGKLPSRGDFIDRGLPGTFLKPWREWIDRALSASRARLGDAWVEVWLEAPIWHFAMPAGACGPDAVLGFTFPSIDRVGRHYPLTVAAVFSGSGPVPAPEIAASWSRGAEALALDALAHDQTPEALYDALVALAMPAPCDGMVSEDAATQIWIEAVWWTDGSPRVPAVRMSLSGLPEAGQFTAMIDAGAS
jgi:type VI secretion system protein ImpM